MTDTNLPLDEAALDRIGNGDTGFGPSIAERLIAQARAALAAKIGGEK